MPISAFTNRTPTGYAESHEKLFAELLAYGFESMLAMLGREHVHKDTLSGLIAEKRPAEDLPQWPDYLIADTESWDYEAVIGNFVGLVAAARTVDDLRGLLDHTLYQPRNGVWEALVKPR